MLIIFACTSLWNLWQPWLAVVFFLMLENVTIIWQYFIYTHEESVSFWKWMYIKTSCGWLSREWINYCKIWFGTPTKVSKVNREIKQFTSILVCRTLRKTFCSLTVALCICRMQPCSPKENLIKLLQSSSHPSVELPCFLHWGLTLFFYPSFSTS